MTVTCGHCGATNPDRAHWCNQCLTDLTSRPSPGSPPAPPRPPLHEVSPAGDVRSGGGGPAALPVTAAGSRRSEHEADDRAVRSVDGTTQWRCATCATWNDLRMGDDVTTAEHLAAARCEVCDGPMRLDPVPVRAVPRAAPAVVLGLNAVAPGAGHLRAGWIGSGLARLVLFAVWLGGGLLLLAGSAAAVATPLLLGAAALWALTIVDSPRAVEGRAQLLTGRVLLWLVVAVTLLTVVGAAGLVVTASGGA